MASLESAARDRMQKTVPQPAAGPDRPAPASGMDDLLAGLEKQARQRLEKTVLVTAYRVSSDIFDPIDGEDRDGQGPVTVRYDPDDPQSAAVEEFSRK